jgi:hypothetical protein
MIVTTFGEVLTSTFSTENGKCVGLLLFPKERKVEMGVKAVE